MRSRACRESGFKFGGLAARLTSSSTAVCCLEYFPSHLAVSVCIDTYIIGLGVEIAQKPYILGLLGPKALKYESFEGKSSNYIYPEGPSTQIVRFSVSKSIP